MLDTMQYITNEIKNQIPAELLYAGFTIDEPPEVVSMTNLESKIVTKLIKKRVLVDANVVAGIELLIPINTLEPKFYEYGYTIYYIDPTLVMSKEVISCLGITYLPPTAYPSYLNYSSNPVTNTGARVYDSYGSRGVITNAHTELVARNTVIIYANYRALISYAMRVVVENDSNFSNIQPRSYKSLGTLCTLATKAYLYNKLLIPINSGYLASGQELGKFQEVLESYSDAHEQYDTYLREVWSKTAFMNDTTRYNRYLKSMISPGV
jgi:hypothetical protein